MSKERAIECINRAKYNLMEIKAYNFRTLHAGIFIFLDQALKELEEE